MASWLKKLLGGDRGQKKGDVAEESHASAPNEPASIGDGPLEDSDDSPVRVTMEGGAMMMTVDARKLAEAEQRFAALHPEEQRRRVAAMDARLEEQRWSVRSRSSPSGAWKLQINAEKDGRLVGPDARVVMLPKMERPEEGVIFDDGRAIVVDWRNENFAGRILIFGAEGSLVNQIDFPVNIGFPVADHAARLAYVECYGSPDPAVDVPSMVAVRVDDGTIAWSVKEMSARAVPDPDGRGVRLYTGRVPEHLLPREQEHAGTKYFLLLSHHGEVLERYPANGYQALDWAWAAYDESRIADARHWLAEVLEAQVGDRKVSEWAWSRAKRLQGDLAAKEGDLEGALACYHEALAQRPQEGYGWARDARTRGNAQAAMTVLDALERLGMDDSLASKVALLRGEVAEQRGELSRAFEEYRRAAAVGKLRDLSQLLMAKGEDSLALSCLEEALCREPKKGLSWAKEAKREGRPVEARQWIEVMLKFTLEAEFAAKAQRLAGELAEERGDREAALTAYRAALALNPAVGVKGKLERLERNAD